jgi:hypothetical protein
VPSAARVAWLVFLVENAAAPFLFRAATAASAPLAAAPQPTPPSIRIRTRHLAHPSLPVAACSPFAASSSPPVASIPVVPLLFLFVCALPFPFADPPVRPSTRRARAAPPSLRTQGHVTTLVSFLHPAPLVCAMAESQPLHPHADEEVSPTGCNSRSQSAAAAHADGRAPHQRPRCAPAKLVTHVAGDRGVSAPASLAHSSLLPLSLLVDACCLNLPPSTPVAASAHVLLPLLQHPPLLSGRQSAHSVPIMQQHTRPQQRASDKMHGLLVSACLSAAVALHPGATHATRPHSHAAAHSPQHSTWGRRHWLLTYVLN